MAANPFAYKPLSRPDNVRLIWLWPGSADAPIALSLFESCLDKESEQYSPFFALSYVWGNGRYKIPIKVNGEEFAVNKNLHEFLCHARDKEERKGPYWIDAVCINQNNNEEKAVQVNMMGEIYRNTHRAVVWLGAEEDDCHLAFALFKAVEEMLFCQHARLCEEDDKEALIHGSVQTAHELHSILANVLPPAPPSSLEVKVAQWRLWGTLQSSLPPPFSADAWSAVMKLFKRPWFQRSWIVQEYLLPKEIDIRCGSILMDSWRLMIFSEVFGRLYMAQGSPPGLGRDFVHTFGYCSQLCSPRLIYQQIGKRMDLIDLVAVHRRKGATDPRDKIFAHLGSSGNTSFKADYNKSVAEVYHEFALAHVKDVQHPKNWNEAACASRFLNIQDDLQRRTPDLPTWVPDWCSPRRQESCLPAAYSAGGEPTLVKFRPSDDGASLHIRGVVFEAIYTVRSLEDVELAPDSIDNLKGIASNDPVFSQAAHSVGRLTEEILGRTITCDTLIQTSQAGTEDMRDYETIYELMPGEVYPVHYIIDRILVLTQGGHMALAPLESQSGDIVAVFAGCANPQVLRPTDGHYEMIGACFCLELMNKQLINDVKAGKRLMQEFEIR